MRRTVIEAATYAEMSQRAAEYVTCFIEATPRAVIALPTGETPVGMYAQLIEMLASKPVDCSGLFLVNLDEFVGLRPDQPGSFGHALREILLDRAPIAEAAYRLLDGGSAHLRHRPKRSASTRRAHDRRAP